MASAIPTILKGDDSGAINITLASGRSYLGATLVVAYQGVTRSFTNLNPGQTVALTFTHNETATFALKTAPLLMRLIGAAGAEETVGNADARIKVTDCLADVNAGGSFIVTPGQAGSDPTKVPITDVGDMSSRYSLADLQAKVNQIVRVLAQRSLLAFGGVALLSGAAFGGVQTARLDSLYNDSLVVTNVTDVSGEDTNAVHKTDVAWTNRVKSVNGKTGDVIVSGGADTNAVKSIINDEVGGTNTIFHTSGGTIYGSTSVTGTVYVGCIENQGPLIRHSRDAINANGRINVKGTYTESFSSTLPSGVRVYLNEYPINGDETMYSVDALYRTYYDRGPRGTKKNDVTNWLPKVSGTLAVVGDWEKSPSWSKLTPNAQGMNAQTITNVSEEVSITNNVELASTTFVSNSVALKQDALSSTQLAATTSGITADKVTTYDGYAATIAGKQDKMYIETSYYVDLFLLPKTNGVNCIWWDQGGMTFKQCDCQIIGQPTFYGPYEERGDCWRAKIRYKSDWFADTDVYVYYVGGEDFYGEMPIAQSGTLTITTSDGKTVEITDGLSLTRSMVSVPIKVNVSNCVYTNVSDSTTNLVSSFGIKSAIDAVTNTADSTSVFATNLLALSRADSESIAEAVVSGAMPQKCETWNRPGLWTIGTEIVSGVITNYTAYTNDDEYGRSIVDYSYDINGGRMAKLNQVKLDDIAIEIAPVTSWISLTEGATVSSNFISSVTDGVYRVQATDASNVVKYANVNLAAYRTSKIEGMAYMSDEMQSRNAIYDLAVSTITNAQLIGTVTDEGKTYNVYSTVAHTNMFPKQVGNVAQSAFSQHVLFGSKHYPNKVINTQRFGDVTVRKLEWIGLSEWAATNGFTQVEIAEANCEDIAMIICDKSTAVPDEFIPYYTTDEKISQTFGTVEGLPAWVTGQLSPHPFPLVMRSLDRFAIIDVPAFDQYGRNDWVEAIRAKSNWIPVISGDCAKMIYLEYDNKQIALTSFWKGNMGPNFAKSYRIIKAFVEWYGDTLKTW